MMAVRLAGLVAMLGILASPSIARAQASGPRYEVSGSVLLTGRTDFGSQPATLTANDPGDPNFTLFSTTTTLGTGVGPEVRLSAAVTRALAVEGAYSWVHQTLHARITGDTEGAPDVTLTQSLSTTSIGADARLSLTRAAFSRGRGAPFLLAGGGYFRQLDDQQMRTASGGYFDAGGGLRYLVSQRAHGFPRTLAIRADGRVVVRSGGFDLGDVGGAQTTWAVSAGLSAGF
jgi:hypothetical protein